MTDADGPSRADLVLAEISDLVVAHFDGAFAAEDIRTDVNLLDGTTPLVATRRLDSLDLVEIMAVVEEHFDVTIATHLASDEPLTLSSVAHHIAMSTS